MENRKRPKIEKLFKVKEKFHKDFAKLPFEKKDRNTCSFARDCKRCQRFFKAKKRIWKIK